MFMHYFSFKSEGSRHTTAACAAAFLILVPLLLRADERSKTPTTRTSPPERVLPRVESVLFDDSALVTHPGGGAGGADASAVQNVTFGLAEYGYCHWAGLNNKLADDFVVAESGGWTIDTLTFYAFQTFTGTSSPFIALEWEIYDGDPSAGGTLVCTDSATLGNGRLITGWTGIYRTLETNISSSTARPIMYNQCIINPPCTLGPGTYWFVIQAWSTIESCIWGPPVTILGTPATGNGKQFQGSGSLWVDLVDNAYPQGVPFQIKGSVNTDICADFTSLLARCVAGGTVQARVALLSNTSHTGEVVTFQVDDNLYTATIVSNGTHSRAQISAVGYSTGTHTVTLIDPPDCLDPRTVTCAGGRAGNDESWAYDDGFREEDRARSEPSAASEFLGNYPNPFNSMTRISYTLNRDTWVTLKVYDLLGREVATLVDELQRAGLKSVVWEGRRDNGISVASGVYVYRLSAVDFTVSRMMLLTK